MNLDSGVLAALGGLVASRKERIQMVSIRHLLAAAVVLAGVAGAPAVASADRLWSSVGAGCVPADEDVMVGNYDTRGFGIGFFGTFTGDIRLVCPVTLRATGAAPTLQTIVLSYKDPDGTGTQSRVTAVMRQVSDGSNASTALCTADSNVSGATGPTTTSCNFFPQFAASTTVSYFVEVVISRTVTTRDPEFLAVAITGI